MSLAGGAAAGVTAARPHRPVRPASGDDRTLRRRINRLLLLGVGLQAVLVAVVIGTAVGAAVSGLRAVADGGQEAAASSLLASMASQQSGLLAFMDAPDQADTLLLYTESRLESDRALGLLHAESAGTSQQALAALVETDARSWEDWADSVHQEVLFSGEPLTKPVVVDEGRYRFSRFRSDQAELVRTLRADQASGGQVALALTLAKVVAVAGGSIPVALLLVLTARRVVRQGLRPLGQLAGTAAKIASEGHVAIPYVHGGDEVGELARALLGWQEASAVRTILAEQAPIGICRIGPDGRFLTANPMLERMLGYGRDELVGRELWSVSHEEDRAGVRERFAAMMGGTMDRLRMQRRWLRRDGTDLWCSIVAAPVPGADGRPETVVGIIEDISERRREAERAARVQRDLLPSETPQLDGYALAAACVPMHNVAGDYYDWSQPTDGHLDLTVADVMGKEVGSALVMATLGMALRAMPRELSPKEKIELVAHSMSRALTDEGLFVTMFHGRLDLATGVLHYVDAGHGYCLIWRANGSIVPLRARSLPLGVLSEERYEEGRARLMPGDTLLVYTDGLVEAEDRIVEAEELVASLRGAWTVEDLVHQLVDSVGEGRADDVTVLILRRDR